MSVRTKLLNSVLNHSLHNTPEEMEGLVPLPRCVPSSVAISALRQCSYATLPLPRLRSLRGVGHSRSPQWPERWKRSPGGLANPNPTANLLKPFLGWSLLFRIIFAVCICSFVEKDQRVNIVPHYLWQAVSIGPEKDSRET